MRRRIWHFILAGALAAGGARGGELSGWDYYRLGEFAVAARAFERAATTGDVGALYGLAVTWDWRRPGEDREKARQLYEQVIAQAPASEWAAWSALALARLKATQPPGKELPVAEALAGYQRVIEQYRDHPAGEEAFLFLQATRLAQLEPAAAAARAELEGFVKERPQSPYRSAAHGLIAYACEVLGDGAGQLAALLAQWRTAEVDPLNPVRDWSWTYWRIATVAHFEVGDFEVAREFYGKFIAEYPTDQKVFLAKQQLQRMDEAEQAVRNRQSANRNEIK